MNLQKIVKFLTRKTPSAEGGYVLQDDGDGAYIKEWFEPLLGTMPAEADIVALAEDSAYLEWLASESQMTYAALFKLLSRQLRAACHLAKDVMLSDDELAVKAAGYALEDLLRDIQTGTEMYDNNDVAQRGEFDVVRGMFVTAGALTTAQADTWGALEKVT